MVFISSSEKEDRKKEAVKHYWDAGYNQSAPSCLSAFPSLPVPLTRLLSRKAADRSCHFATALCSTQPATGSVPPWPLDAPQPSLVSVLFLKHYIRITAERICLSKSVVRWETLLMWQREDGSEWSMSNTWWLRKVFTSPQVGTPQNKSKGCFSLHCSVGVWLIQMKLCWLGDKHVLHFLFLLHNESPLWVCWGEAFNV